MIYVLVIQETNKDGTIGVSFIAGSTTIQETADLWETQEKKGYTFISWPVDKDNLTAYSTWPENFKRVYTKFKKILLES